MENYEQLFYMALYTIIENARKNNCEGCPLKGSGADRKKGSCRTRLIAYYKEKSEGVLL